MPCAHTRQAVRQVALAVWQVYVFTAFHNECTHCAHFINQAEDEVRPRALTPFQLTHSCEQAANLIEIIVREGLVWRSLTGFSFDYGGGHERFELFVAQKRGVVVAFPYPSVSVQLEEILELAYTDQ